ncbi:eukaryotic peptide chain release factor GTP-binding subunit ERF3A [Hyalella azteca]|uniref:Eukaryotic peptide chain release factor GTP-binding subunit ERF3A n=1 Tax=Hyalella azteca TaxID=294128 RepID=A0A8B7NHZ2_HYAAZ|nr:eukaryotic peptide chain release factor GTP-binding subunit ERF3A [Hyalella azteca]
MSDSSVTVQKLNMTDNTSTPDSWETVADGGLNASLSRLNVNAAVFVPNVNAAEFIPSFRKEPQAPDPPPEQESACTVPEPVPPSSSPLVSSPSVSSPTPSSPAHLPSSHSSPSHNTLPPNLSSPSSTSPAVMVNSINDATAQPEAPVEAPAAATAAASPLKTRAVINNDNTADSWEEAADAATPSPSHSADTSSTPHTPEDDEDDDVDDDSEELEDKKKKKKPVILDDGPSKEPVNVIFIGHVDAGKSTIGGQIMYLTGMVDKRTLDKYEREAKEKNRETWYLSWALDTNLEERDKGKTVEVGRAYFETEQKHFTILDAPGHKSFVPNMIGGASQADLAVLVISARKGEFETGFERGGQTREHAMLAKTAGVKHLIVLINKMDDPTVQWSQERYNECKDKLVPYLKRVGFNPSRDIMFMPCSGLTGCNLRYPMDPALCPWYDGPAFIPYINDLPPLNRNTTGPFMMPISDRYNDRGTIVLGKVESGSCRKNDSLILMPNKSPVTLDVLWRDDDEVNVVTCGENVKAKLRGVEETDIAPGFVLCDPLNPCKTGRIFDGQVVILEHKSIICAGYSAVCHIHSVAEEVTVKMLICTVDKKTNKPQKVGPRFVKQDQIAIMRFETSGVICMESFKDHPQLGRFTLRDEGKTIAIGKVLKVVD